MNPVEQKEAVDNALTHSFGAQKKRGLLWVLNISCDKALEVTQMFRHVTFILSTVMIVVDIPRCPFISLIWTQFFRTCWSTPPWAVLSACAKLRRDTISFLIFIFGWPCIEIKKLVYFYYQLDAQILYCNTFITFLYMFRALLCSSSGRQIVLVQHLVPSRSLGNSSVHTLREDSPLCTERSPTEPDGTRCCTYTICPPEYYA